MKINRNLLFAAALATAAPAGVMSPSAAAQDDVEEIIVTGSHIRGTPENAELPVDVLRRADSRSNDEADYSSASMGGHGTWYLGSLYASRFAAIAPSAGWVSFFTYHRGMKKDYGDAPALTPSRARPPVSCRSN